MLGSGFRFRVCGRSLRVEGLGVSGGYRGTGFGGFGGLGVSVVAGV